MKKFNHAYDFAFEVISSNEDGEDVTPAMLLKACRARLDAIEAENEGAEMLEACGLFDTMEAEPPKPRPFTPTVMLHGFVNLPDGSTEHFDGDNGHGYHPDAWCVWLRRDYIDADPATEETFDDDTTREAFFDDPTDALIYAGELAAELQCEMEEY